MRGMPEPVEVILLRQWASYMDYPVWIMNAGGDLIYFNEKAAPLIGQSYGQIGDIAVADIAALFETTDLDGSPLANDELPIVRALLKREPGFRRLRFRGFDGVWRIIDTSAFPITGAGDRNLGAAVLFWEVEP